MAKATGSPTAGVFKLIKDQGVKMIDFKYIDFPGQWQHFSVPAAQLDLSLVGKAFEAE